MRTQLIVAFLFLFHLLHAQGRWHPHVAAYAGINADAFFVTAVPQIGADYLLGKRAVLSGAAQYFYSNVNRVYAGTPERGRLRVASLLVLAQAHPTGYQRPGLLAALGLAFQHSRGYAADDQFRRSYDRTLLLPAGRLGYQLHLGRGFLSLELQGTGPLHYREDEVDVTELLTVAELGLRYRF